MNYIGSKAQLIPFLKQHIVSSIKEDISKMLFCDLFAGMGTVGHAFSGEVGRVISNDAEYYAYVQNYCLLKAAYSSKFQECLDSLNTLKGVKGFVYTHYSFQSGRNYFSDENAQKVDAVRMQIQTWYEAAEIDKNLYFLLLASLMHAADKVSNTASLYGAYLKYTKQSALEELYLLPIECAGSDNENEVYNMDANELIKNINGDILYLDPPYNHRQYGANYHILNTICHYDDFKPKGKTGVRPYESSAYCKKTHVLYSFNELIKNADFRYIFLSYNDEALMDEAAIKNIMSKYGKYSLVKKEHQRFKSHKKYKPNINEHLHILIKD